MRLVVANHSSYPRVGDSPESQRLRRAYAAAETGDISPAGYGDVVRDYIAEIVAEQARAGCDIVTDGQVHWYDCISHLAGRLDGVRINGLHRFFDTNHLIRRPEIIGQLHGSPGLVADYTFATTVASKTVKPVVTGPYSLARHSLLGSEVYPNLEGLALGYADIIADELAGFAKAGAAVVQLEEPSLLAHPADIGIARKAITRAVATKGTLTVSLVTYFGDAAALWRQLLDMPVEMLGVDLIYGSGVADIVARDGCDRPLSLGVVDGRNTRDEPTEPLVDLVGRVAAALEPRGVDELHLQASCGLEYLPRDRAERKLRRLAQIRDVLTGATT